MRFPTKTLTGLGIAVLAAGLTACSAQQPQADSSASLTLQTYTVPDGRARELSTTLNHVLYKNTIGRTWFAGSHQVLVLAPERMQNSIAASLKEMTAKMASAQKPSGPVRLNAWVVDAYPGKGPADLSLNVIQPALEDFSDNLGPAHFVLARYLTAVSDIGAHTALRPSPPQFFGYIVEQESGGPALKFNYSDGPVGLQGEVTVPFGQTMILGLISDQAVGSSSGPAGKHAPRAGESDTGTADRIAGVVHRLLVVRLTPASPG